MAKLMADKDTSTPAVPMIALSGAYIGLRIQFAWTDDQYGIDHVITGELCSVNHDRGERVDGSGVTTGTQINTAIEIRGRNRKCQQFRFKDSRQSVEVLK